MQIHILGFFDCIIKTTNQEIATFNVVRDGKKNVLWKDTAIASNILRVGLEINKVSVASFPKTKYVTVDIPTDKTITPVSQPNRKVPMHLESKIKKTLDELLVLDIIEEVKVKGIAYGTCS